MRKKSSDNRYSFCNYFGSNVAAAAASTSFQGMPIASATPSTVCWISFIAVCNMAELDMFIDTTHIACRI